MTFACCLMLTNLFSYLIHDFNPPDKASLRLTQQMNAFEFLFFSAFFLFLLLCLVYLKFHLKIVYVIVCCECFHSWDSKFSCEMLKGSNDEHQSTTHLAFLLPAFMHSNSISSLKVKTFFFFGHTKNY